MVVKLSLERSKEGSLEAPRSPLLLTSVGMSLKSIIWGNITTMNNKTYLFADGAGYLLLVLLALFQIAVLIYSIVTGVSNFASAGTAQTGVLLNSSILMVSMFVESNMLVVCRGTLFVYAINDSQALPLTHDNLCLVLDRFKRIYAPGSANKFSEKPKSALMRTAFYLAATIVTLIEGGECLASICAVGGFQSSPSFLWFAFVLLLLDFGFIANRFCSHASIRYFWSSFGRRRMAVLKEEAGNWDAIARTRKMMFLFAFLWVTSMIGTMR